MKLNVITSTGLIHIEINENTTVAEFKEKMMKSSLRKAITFHQNGTPSLVMTYENKSDDKKKLMEFYLETVKQLLNEKVSIVVSYNTSIQARPIKSHSNPIMTSTLTTFSKPPIAEDMEEEDLLAAPSSVKSSPSVKTTLLAKPTTVHSDPELRSKNAFWKNASRGTALNAVLEEEGEKAVQQLKSASGN